MKTFACKDMGMDCDFVASGETVEEVVNKAITHAQLVHADMLKQMSSTPTGMADMEKGIVKAIK